MKVPDYIRKYANKAGKYAHLHRIHRNKFEEWLELKGIDMHKLCDCGGDEFGYTDCVGYGLGSLNWDEFEKEIEAYKNLEEAK